MKVYSCPPEIPAPQPDYTNYDHAKETAAEEAHSAALKEWLITNGWSGKYTGEIYSEGVADGAALYMLGDNGAKSILIHLPYGDGYQSLNVQHVPRKVIIERIEAGKRLAALFGKRATG